MAAPQSQAVCLLLHLFSHLGSLILQHSEALQLPILAIRQLVRVRGGERECQGSAVTTLTYNDNSDQTWIPIKKDPHPAR